MATVNIPIHFAMLAIMGPAQVNVHHHIHHVMKTMSVSCSICLISASLSSADFLHISGFAQAPNPLVRLSQIFIFLSAMLAAKSCASVLIATKETHSSHSPIILSIALFQQPHIHKTLILAPGINSGLISCITIFLR